jgi:proteasome lid subunit RPN8/RPN11
MIDTKRLKQKLINFLGFNKYHFTSIYLTKDLIENIKDLAKNNHPREFIALTDGRIKNNNLIISSIRMESFQSSNESARFQNVFFPLTDFKGLVHSHPKPSNRPSSKDRRTFNKYPGVHIIICYPYREEDIAVYDLNANKINYNIKN